MYTKTKMTVLLMSILFSLAGFVCVAQQGTVTDIEGHVYRTVVIGTQEWMAENLRVTSYSNGEAIPTIADANEWFNTREGAYAVYPHEEIEGLDSQQQVMEAYGVLYNFHAAVDARGLCPVGWHVPSEAEWEEMIEYLVRKYGWSNESSWDNAEGLGNQLKSCRMLRSPLGDACDTDEHPRWDAHRRHIALDHLGFAALPGGNLVARGGQFLNIGRFAPWWTSSEQPATDWDPAQGISYNLAVADPSLRKLVVRDKTTGYGIRCIRSTP